MTKWVVTRSSLTTIDSSLGLHLRLSGSSRGLHSWHFDAQVSSLESWFVTFVVWVIKMSSVWVVQVINILGTLSEDWNFIAKISQVFASCLSCWFLYFSVGNKKWETRNEKQERRNEKWKTEKASQVKMSWVPWKYIRDVRVSPSRWLVGDLWVQYLQVTPLFDII